MEAFPDEQIKKLAQELYLNRVEMSEVGRVLQFLRQRINSGDEGAKDLDVFLERMAAQGNSFFVNPEAYKKMQTLRASLLTGIEDGKQLFVMFEAALALMRCFREVPSLAPRVQVEEKPKPVAKGQSERKPEDRTKFSPFAVLRSPLPAAPSAVSVAEKPVQLKRGDRVVAVVSSIEGGTIIAFCEGVEIRFDKPLYGAPEIDNRVEVQIQSQQPAFWRATFRRIK